MTESSQARREAEPLNAPVAHSHSVLVVGDAGLGPPPEGLSGSSVVFVQIEEVGAELLETLAPSVVLSPLLTRSFDCIDLARILHELGFRGSYRAISPVLPQPDLVRREIALICPGLSFDLIVVPDLAVVTEEPLPRLRR